MANFNRFLIIIITILALAAAVMSYFLFERRNEFRNRATDLSESVEKIVQKLDNESGTELRQKITFNPAVSEEGIPESGSLSWKNYNQDPQKYNTLLEQAENFAGKINSQKNFLGDEFAQVGFDLGIPVEDLSTKTFKETKTPENYKAAANRISRLAQAMGERSSALIQTLENTSNVIGYSLDTDRLNERVEETTKEGDTIARGFKYEDPLNGYRGAIIDINTRCSDYASALASLTENVTAHDWSVSTENLKSNDDYGQALTTLQKDMSEIDSKLTELKQKRKQVQELEEENAALKEELAESEVEKEKVEQLKAKLRKARAQKRITDEPGKAGQDAEDSQLRGETRVVKVNPDWNYVIINAGEGKIKEGATLAVGRDGEFIAQVKVTKVTPTIAVADILPETQKGKIQKNDRIYKSSTM